MYNNAIRGARKYNIHDSANEMMRDPETGLTGTRQPGPNGIARDPRSNPVMVHLHEMNRSSNERDAFPGGGQQAGGPLGAIAEDAEQRRALFSFTCPTVTCPEEINCTCPSLPDCVCPSLPSCGPLSPTTRVYLSYAAGFIGMSALGVGAYLVYNKLETKAIADETNQIAGITNQIANATNSITYPWGT